MNTLFFKSDGSRSESLAAKPAAAAFDFKGAVDNAAKAAADEACELMRSRRVSWVFSLLVERASRLSSLLIKKNSTGHMVRCVALFLVVSL